MDIKSIVEAIDLSEFSIATRLVIAVLVGGIIGMEREHKHRPAGFRTHILVCLGSALTSLTSIYICYSYAIEVLNTQGMEFSAWPCDPLRLSAQVIAGIGFIGAGSIIVTRRSQVKGLTTAAGLWTTAIVGIAIGLGFYVAVAYTAVLILIAEMVLSRMEVLLATKARNVNIYVEYESVEILKRIKGLIEDRSSKILDLEIAKTHGADHPHMSAILSIQLEGKTTFEEITTEMARIDGIYSVQEL